MNHLHPRDQILQTMDRIYRYRMTTTSGGNLSILDDDGSVWITPSRVDKGGLKREDIVRILPDGTQEGAHPPSSELPFHQAIYKMRPEIRAVVHAHPVALVAFSLAGKIPETKILPVAADLVGTPGYAGYGLPGSQDLGDKIAEVFRKGFFSAILENHGTVCAGSDMTEAFARFETLEFSARTELRARGLGGIRSMDAARLAAWKNAGEKLAGTGGVDVISSAEKEARKVLSEFVQRAYRQRLVISTEGAFSVRLSADEFLITPRKQDRIQIGPEDLVKIKGGKSVMPGLESRMARFHAAVYKAQPDIGCVMTATPVHATAFAVSGKALDTRTIPESYIFLREVATLSWEDTQNLDEKKAARIRPAQPVWLLENQGVLTTGKTVLEAFDRLEVLESTAHAVYESRTLGELRPMDKAVIDELKQAFRLED